MSSAATITPTTRPGKIRAPILVEILSAPNGNHNARNGPYRQSTGALRRVKRLYRQSITAAPHVKPPPKLASRIRLPGPIRPSRSATLSAIGRVAVEELANWST